jgi:uncharacterized protein (DUF2062 family)
MIHFTKALVRRWLNGLLHINDTPERTASAFALGVFFGFSPFLGLHTLLAVGLAFLLNLNRVAVILGVYSNVPWTIAAYYAFTTWVGSLITRTRLPAGLRERIMGVFEESHFHAEFWRELGTILRPMLWPYVVGSLIGAVVMAGIAYPLALAFVTRARASRRRIQDIMHHKPD